MEEAGDLLEAWGLSDLKPIFTKNAINLHALTALSLEDIKELIPQLGPRALFLRCWKNWHSEYTTSTTVNISASDLNSISISDLNFETESGTQNISIPKCTATVCPSVVSAVPATYTSRDTFTSHTTFVTSATVPRTSSGVMLTSTLPIKINIIVQNLVEDFNQSDPNHTNNLYLNFPSIKIRLIELLKKKNSKDSYWDDIKKLADGDTEENRNLAAILSRTELITPNIVALSTSSRTESSPPAAKKREEKKANGDHQSRRVAKRCPD